jgi:hypothetical protein
VKAIWNTIKARLIFVNFILLGLAFLSLSSLDGEDDDPTAGSGLFRILAAVYVLVSSLVLLILPQDWVVEVEVGDEAVTFESNKHLRLIQTIAWGMMCAGALFFAAVSPVWYSWLLVAVGAMSQLITGLTTKKVIPLEF